jgi:hypothetical protein
MPRRPEREDFNLHVYEHDTLSIYRVSVILPPTENIFHILIATPHRLLL